MGRTGWLVSVDKQAQNIRLKSRLSNHSRATHLYKFILPHSQVQVLGQLRVLGFASSPQLPSVAWTLAGTNSIQGLPVPLGFWVGLGSKPGSTVITTSIQSFSQNQNGHFVDDIPHSLISPGLHGLAMSLPI